MTGQCGYLTAQPSCASEVLRGIRTRSTFLHRSFLCSVPSPTPPSSLLSINPHPTTHWHKKHLSGFASWELIYDSAYGPPCLSSAPWFVLQNITRKVILKGQVIHCPQYSCDTKTFNYFFCVGGPRHMALPLSLAPQKSLFLPSTRFHIKRGTLEGEKSGSKRRKDSGGDIQCGQKWVWKTLGFLWVGHRFHNKLTHPHPHSHLFVYPIQYLPFRDQLYGDQKEFLPWSSWVFFFFFGSTCSPWKFLGQGLNPSLSSELCHSCRDIRSLTHVHRAGDQTSTSTETSWILNPLRYSRNSHLGHSEKRALPGDADDLDSSRGGEKPQPSLIPGPSLQAYLPYRLLAIYLIFMSLHFLICKRE